MDVYTGMIIQTGFSFATQNWGLCYGQLEPISRNEALFSLLGTYYGGDARTTFGIPDLRGRVSIGQGDGPGLTPRPIGQKYGFEQVTLTIQNLPSHTHTHSYVGAGGSNPISVNVNTTLKATKQDGTLTVPEDSAYLAASKEVGAGKSDYMYIPSSSVDSSEEVLLGGISSTAVASGGGSFDNNLFNIEPTGNGEPLFNMQPYLVVNYQICMYGIYPSRK